MKKFILFIAVAALFVSCAPKPEPLVMPDDFIALLDYKQLPGGKNYGAVMVVSNNYKGTVKVEGRDKSKSMKIKPKQIKEFPVAFDLNVGDVLKVTAGGRTQEIPIKYDRPQMISLGYVESKSAMFTKNTVFYATKGRGQYITIIHIAKDKKTTYGYPGKNTVWYACSVKNRITVNDTQGIVNIKGPKLVNRGIYYVTSYFYDSDYNYLGGSPSWEARFLDR